jgi:hypothetical protein
MEETLTDMPRGDSKAWSLDQLSKSEFFHQKLHEWGLLTTFKHTHVG